MKKIYEAQTADLSNDDIAKIAGDDVVELIYMTNKVSEILKNPQNYPPRILPISNYEKVTLSARKKVIR